ncbi:transmembrane protein FAM155A [Aplysia californica]|uniref:Transmembrane protein FAM155A n=1 Tax=Aplysia californica TaxID=6500 RepID=A0ABM0JYL1_APLCA|nr:transmembrane protein FAM155A [Aplysia californica]
MMTSQASKVLDPMYNFDTHFPERLSRLHIHGDFNASGSFRKKKSRAQRSGARYKTQPVTFDEIKEVDEEPAANSSGSAKDGEKRASSSEQLMGQLQAFSRSMDGLLPKSAVFPDHVSFHVSHSRSGSRKFQRHPDCIPERAEAEAQQKQQQQEQQQQQQQKDQNPEQRLSESSTSATGSLTTPASQQTSTLTPPTEAGGGGASSEGGSPSPVPSPNIAPRRQKITAKAKKRQKAQGEGGDGNLDT